MKREREGYRNEAIEREGGNRGLRESGKSGEKEYLSWVKRNRSSYWEDAIQNEERQREGIGY